MNDFQIVLKQSGPRKEAIALTKQCIFCVIFLIFTEFYTLSVKGTYGDNGLFSLFTHFFLVGLHVSAANLSGPTLEVALGDKNGWKHTQ